MEGLPKNYLKAARQEAILSRRLTYQSQKIALEMRKDSVAMKTMSLFTENWDAAEYFDEIFSNVLLIVKFFFFFSKSRSP